MKIETIEYMYFYITQTEKGRLDLHPDQLRMPKL